MLNFNDNTFRAMLAPIALGVTALVAGCNFGDKDDGDIPPETPAAEVTGKANSPSTGSKDAVVHAERVRQDGTMYEVSEADERTDDDGVYRLSLTSETAAALVVYADFDDGSRGAVLVNGAASANDSTTAAPMSEETDAEAGFYALIRGEQIEDDDDSGSVLRAFVSGDVAAAWTDTDDTDRSSLAFGTAAAVQAWERSGGDRSDNAIAAVVAATTDADKRGHDTGAVVSEADARLVLTDAWEDAGASRADLSFMAAAAINAQERAGGMSSGDDAQAGFLWTLRGEVATEVIQDAGNQFDDGVLDLDALVVAVLDGDSGDLMVVLALSLDVDQLDAVESARDDVAQARASMYADIDAASDAQTGDASAEAVASFRSTVEVDVAADLQASGAFDKAEAQAMASILAQLYVVGDAD